MQDVLCICGFDDIKAWHTCHTVPFDYTAAYSIPLPLAPTSRLPVLRFGSVHNIQASPQNFWQRLEWSILDSILWSVGVGCDINWWWIGCSVWGGCGTSLLTSSYTACRLSSYYSSTGLILLWQLLPVCLNYDTILCILELILSIVLEPVLYMTLFCLTACLCSAEALDTGAVSEWVVS